MSRYYENSDEFENTSDEDEDQIEYLFDKPLDTDELFDRAHCIVNLLRYYAFSRGLDMMTSSNVVMDTVDLITWNESN